MTVAELIANLQTFDPNMAVVTRGYEDGYDTVDATEARQMVWGEHGHPWRGEYQNGSAEEIEAMGRNCVFIGKAEYHGE
ncbi:MAG TPA: hypothetical protein PLF80_12220 [Flavobacteriales bacterium]|nr:hypothetical protein [Flavobacteriales bacterium]